jgi:antitoxin (DNA-binding transcriptional repressor) of toxin-antitoxin stability system
MDDRRLTPAATPCASAGTSAGPGTRVDVTDLRARLATCLAEVAQGGRIEAVSRRREVAELRPPAPTRASTRGWLNGRIGQSPDWHEASDELAGRFENSVI